MNIFVDFHHSSLLRSLVLLFEKRMNHAVYRPIGMEWFYQGYWAINSSEDTAKQFLFQDYQSVTDGTPPLNRTSTSDCGLYRVYDPGQVSSHRAVTFEAFKHMKFDIIIASIPAHVPLYQRLIEVYQPQAKLVVQVGNEWDLSYFSGLDILASIKPRSVPEDTNVMFYHQEFDLDIFKATWPKKTNFVSSYINVLQGMKVGWPDFLALEKGLSRHGVKMSSYGGQCRDGNLNGVRELAESMSNDQFIFHVKDGGDGFGHILYNAYACGRPVITRKSFYKGKLAEELMNEKNTIDLDEISAGDAVELITEIMNDQTKMTEACQAAYSSFYSCVNYKEEAEAVSSWINQIKERQ
jgi:hypothetical protein